MEKDAGYHLSYKFGFDKCETVVFVCVVNRGVQDIKCCCTRGVCLVDTEVWYSNVAINLSFEESDN